MHFQACVQAKWAPVMVKKALGQKVKSTHGTESEKHTQARGESELLRNCPLQLQQKSEADRGTSVTQGARAVCYR